MRAAGAVLLVLAPAAVAAPATAQPAADVRGIDWHDAEFEVPRVGPCPQQHVRFSGGAARTDGWVYRFTPERGIDYADVTGDGTEDVLALVDCGPPRSEYSTALVALTRSPDGSVVPLGTVVSPGTWRQVPVDFTTWHGDVAVTLTDQDTGARWNEYHRWVPDLGGFARIDG
ncbi:hypothetical protein IQ251_08115 [Saccharopolyspora sp. HNM0983]|uniref:VCBS repeat-containing protein n=1 Tax=Saccharopolyspora montiporae TaxID=2781240 RepID=A0A929B711_9PSEU|nr:hypothetical protein [Saccharopolyspora sp. HNM0983]